jgi:hypothetical protein
MRCNDQGVVMPKYPVEPVAIEYYSRSKRVRRVFTDHFEAKQFYCQKYKAGKRPKVIKVNTTVQ